MTADLTAIEKIRLLTSKHNLGYLLNPGGATFTNHDGEKEIRIHVLANDDQEDYEVLLGGLRALGMEE